MGARASQAAQQQTAADDPNPEAAWWCKLLARVVAVAGAGIAIAMGVWTCVTVKPICIGAGIIQIFIAFIVLVIEAPICCQWFEGTQVIARFAEKRSWFQKALIYGILAIIPIAMCFGISTLFGAGLIFAAAVLYGLMALGKKGTLRQEQAAADQQKLNAGAAESGEAPPYNHPSAPAPPAGPPSYNDVQSQAVNYATTQAVNYAANNPQQTANFAKNVYNASSNQY